MEVERNTSNPAIAFVKDVNRVYPIWVRANNGKFPATLCIICWSMQFYLAEAQLLPHGTGFESRRHNQHGWRPRPADRTCRSVRHQVVLPTPQTLCPLWPGSPLAGPTARPAPRRAARLRAAQGTIGARGHPPLPLHLQYCSGQQLQLAAQSLLQQRTWSVPTTPIAIRSNSSPRRLSAGSFALVRQC